MCKAHHSCIKTAILDFISQNWLKFLLDLCTLSSRCWSCLWGQCCCQTLCVLVWAGGSCNLSRLVVLRLNAGRGHLEVGTSPRAVIWICQWRVTCCKEIMASSRLVTRSRDIANVMQRLQGKRWPLAFAFIYSLINWCSYSLLQYTVRAAFLKLSSCFKLIYQKIYMVYLKNSDYEFSGTEFIVMFTSQRCYEPRSIGSDSELNFGAVSAARSGCTSIFSWRRKQKTYLSYSHLQSLWIQSLPINSYVLVLLPFSKEEPDLIALLSIEEFIT